jgi:uncharacterized protein (TIGR04255 family)
MGESALPSYKKPPVIEVVFGVQFKPIDQFIAPHFGILWELLGRNRYPKYQEMAPLPPVIERFDKEWQVAGASIQQFTRPPLPRAFFVDESENHLIQVQQDRFLRNWRKQKGDDEYPRFDGLLPEFEKSWKVFSDFLEAEKLGSLEPNQYELTYVNHIAEGQGWGQLRDIGGVFPDFGCRTEDPFLPEPEGVSWRRVYRLPEAKGRLHVSLGQAYDPGTRKKLLVLTLTVRGFDTKGMSAWFEMAREWIVRGFADLTSREIQKEVWERE